MEVKSFKRGLVISGLAGLLIALTMCVAFGVLDVQCRNDANGPYWNAEAQRCQARDVAPNPSTLN